jgi:hypothetical protein
MPNINAGFREKLNSRGWNKEWDLKIQ